MAERKGKHCGASGKGQFQELLLGPEWCLGGGLEICKVSYSVRGSPDPCLVLSSEQVRFYLKSVVRASDVAVEGLFPVS